MALNPVSKIQKQEWLQDPRAQKVLNALGVDNARFVGGCVRNALLEQPVEDIDIATRLRPEDVQKTLKEQGVKTIPTGIEHGTITAVIDGTPFEITSLRKDVETDGRRAIVAFTDDWVQDARRRDFTMNTLLADALGNVYDPLGCGLSDLNARHVVFVGKPEERIAEDHLRILRFFRFHAMYGEGALDVEALNACAAAANKISGLSRERITQEFLKIISVEDPTDILSLMFERGILTELQFAEYDPETMKALCYFQKSYDLRSAPIRIGILCGFSEGNINSIYNFLLIPKLFQKDIKAISQILSLPDLADDHAVKVAVYKYGRTASAQALMLELAQDRVKNAYAPKALEIIQNWDVPTFPVSGDDLMKQGIKPGPGLGAELERLENEWIEDGFREGG